MGAHIPTCTKQDYLGVCPCDNCKSFIPMSKANKIIKSYLDLDKREEKKGCAAMAELIERDALEPFYESGTDPNDTYADMTFIRAEHIENAPAVNRWIPCSERMPEVGIPVLIYDKHHKAFFVAKLDEDYFGFSSNMWHHPADVPFWMPLPEPPKE